jgi:hypothetical protein
VCPVANLGFAAEVVWFAANFKLSCLQRMCPAVNLGFTAKVVWPTKNFKLSCLQRINIRC